MMRLNGTPNMHGANSHLAYNVMGQSPIPFSFSTGDTFTLLTRHSKWPTVNPLRQRLNGMFDLFAKGTLQLGKRIHAGVSEISRGSTLNSFLFFPPLPEGDGNRSPSGFSAKKVEQLAQKVVSTITSLKTLRAHGLSIDYADDVLLSIFYELRDLHEAITKQKETPSQSRFHENDQSDLAGNIGPHAILEISLPHMMSMPEERPLLIPDDSISLYTSKSPHPTPEQFMETFLNAMISSPLVDSAEFSEDNFEKDPTFEMLVNHAINVANNGVDPIMDQYLKIFQTIEAVEKRAIVKNLDAVKVERPCPSKMADLLKVRYEARPRVWNYDAASQTFIMGSFPSDLKPIDKYFGYRSIKDAMEVHFRTFAGGNPVKPMMLIGPPGVGKTRLTLSYAREFANLSVVVAPNSKIDEMGPIIEMLKGKPQRYVVLFDDINNVDDIKWTQFRGIFEGAGEKAPGNILLIITSNEKLPDNVTTRGLAIEFPDISNPGKSNDAVLGIVRDYFKNHRYSDKISTFSRFVLHDFFGGDVFEDITKNVGRPKPHQFQRSPRGLIDYLDSLTVTGRSKEIYARMRLYEEVLAKIAEDEKVLQEMAAEMGIFSEDSVKVEIQVK